VIVKEPLGYMDFLNLLTNCLLVLTDSGGIQEEACILKIPCVTLRDNTERPETLYVKSNILAGTNVKSIIKAFNIMKERKCTWKNPFGNGTSYIKVINFLEKKI
jgi:UDP-N-acetylglucosamine 2-epimerase (non-hydrolysing)